MTDGLHVPLVNLGRLLITFANSLDTNQARQKTPSLICIKTIRHSGGIPEYFKKVDLEKNQQTTNYPVGKEFELV